MVEIVKILGPKLISLKLAEYTHSWFSKPKLAANWKLFLKECKEFLPIKKIRFNEIFSDVLMKEMQELFIDP